MRNNERMVGDLGAIYANRFQEFETERDRIWQVLTGSYFQKWVQPTDRLLDVGGGYCEFVNNIRAKEKFALDLNPATGVRAAPGVKVLSQDVCQTWPLQSDAIDVVFSSNFFEHLHTKEELTHCLREARRVLRLGGRIIAMGPNIRFCPDVYWDFIDHRLPLSDRSMVEALDSVGFKTETVIPRFLPFTMAGRRPPAPIFVRVYLRLPILWRVFGKQFVIVAHKTDGRHQP